MNKKDRQGIYTNLALISQIGITVVVSIFIGLFIGRFLDEKLGTKWIFTMIFLVIGTLAGFMNLLKIAELGSKKRK